MLGGMPDDASFYLSGLDLRGRAVLVAGAGRVATRRLPALLEAGAVVTVVAPQASELVRELAATGRLAWLPREVRSEDVVGAWYVMAATDSARANALVGEAAERQQTFCVRCDRAAAGSARTPTRLAVDGFTVGVLGTGDPLATRALRDRIAAAITVPAAGSGQQG
ncbi:hypothetical protein GCM10009599_00090 [Luteococcus peritonei]